MTDDRGFAARADELDETPIKDDLFSVAVVTLNAMPGLGSAVAAFLTSW